jgi:hypothetical protein
MTDGSLSTFDISVSCLYFFESEYYSAAPVNYPAVDQGKDGILASMKIAL